MRLKFQIVLIMFLLILSQCKTSDNIVSIRGRAYNTKVGAYIRTKNSKFYYVNSMDEWPEKYYAKKLVVKGKLTVVYDTLELNAEKQRVFKMQKIDSANYRVTIFGFIRKKLPEE